MHYHDPLWIQHLPHTSLWQGHRSFITVECCSILRDPRLAVFGMAEQGGVGKVFSGPSPIFVDEYG